MTFAEGRPWFHGSPQKLTFLRKGSTITQDRRLAEIFSHKPSIVSYEDDGTIQHNGYFQGFLYLISEPIHLDDLSPVPNSSMEPGKEWQTHRDLQVTYVCPTELNSEEILSSEQIKNLLKMKGKQT